MTIPSNDEKPAKKKESGRRGLEIKVPEDVDPVDFLRGFMQVKPLKDNGEGEEEDATDDPTRPPQSVA